MPFAFIIGFLFLWWWLGFVWAVVLTLAIGVCMAFQDAAAVFLAFLAVGLVAWLFIEYGLMGILQFLIGAVDFSS